MMPNLIEQLSRLPIRLGWHILLMALALGAGILISVPLAILATRRRWLQGPLLGVAGIVQTVPSLALLALMVVLMGGLIGFWPAIVALVLYSMLPILRNTVTGLLGVDAAMVEAARGVGMTDRQMLLKVQLPLAAPVIIAGIRTSAVWVVGIATLSTPVGQESLGNYIFTGLDLRNHVATMTGVVAAAGLALALDGLIRLMELAAAQRSRALGILGGAGLALLVLGGLTPLAMAKLSQRAAVTDAGLVRVGAKNFAEQYILAEVLAGQLREAGFRADITESIGSAIIFDALAAGTLDCYVDYSGTIWATVMKRTGSQGGQEVLDEVTEYLRERYGIVCLGALGFENAYALAMTRARANELGVRSIADLAAQAPTMRIGATHEFFGRDEWAAIRDTYELRFAQNVSLSPTLMYGAVRDGQVDVISAFSSDGRIAAYDLVVLEDPRSAIPPYDAILLVSQRAAARPGLLDAMRPLVGAIDDDAMRHANKLVDLDGRTPADAARWLRTR